MKALMKLFFGTSLFLSSSIASSAAIYEFSCSLTQVSTGQTLSAGQIQASLEAPHQELKLSNGSLANKVQIELGQDQTYKLTITTNQNTKNALEYKTSLNNLEKYWRSLQNFPTSVQNSNETVVTTCEGRQVE